MPFENALFPLTRTPLARTFPEPVTLLLLTCGVMVPGLARGPRSAAKGA